MRHTFFVHKKKITVAYLTYELKTRNVTELWYSRRIVQRFGNDDKIPTTPRHRIRAVARVRSRRVYTDFPASAREDHDHFRFSSVRSETGLSVSRPPRSEGCHPAMGLWPIAPALRSCARITTLVSLFLPRRGLGLFPPWWPAFFHRVRIASGLPRHSEARWLTLSSRH